MPSEAVQARGSKVEQESLLPELLHALNQPLTSLRCSLEVTLLQPRDSEEYRNRLRESLKLTEDVMILSRGIRELIDVEQPCREVRTIGMGAVLRSVVREVVPLTDAQGIQMSLLCGPSLNVRGNEQQFFLASLHLVSFLLSLAQGGDKVGVQAGTEGEEIAIKYEFRGKGESADRKARPDAPATASAYLKLLVARRIFEVAGGWVEVEREKSRAAIHVRLPRIAEEIVVHEKEIEGVGAG